MQVVLAKLGPHGFKVEGADYAGEFVPWYKFVDQVEEGDGEAVDEAWLVAGANNRFHFRRRKGRRSERTRC